MSITRDIIIDNYLRKIKPFLIEQDGCLLYSKATPRKPYGYIAFTPVTAKLPNILAHRLSYMFHNDILSTEGFHVLHSCDTPACCNPEHLRLGTNADNMSDRMQREGYKCMQGTKNPGAKLTEKEALAIYISKDNHAASILYNISHRTIASIKRKTYWKSLTNAYDELMV